MTGRTITMELPITQDQIDRWQRGEMIQDVMPHLTPEQREFMISGVTPADWGQLFPAEIKAERIN